mmetsp:Transcript_11177/g.22260  ORF Transcript_11177/g.22260 Transcript_11177/m.22260 type:complete len:245 (+) Transcript_11177:50-784(+)
MSASSISAMVIGCSGALGRAFPKVLPASSTVTSVDINPPPPPRSSNVVTHLPLPPDTSTESMIELLPHLDTVASTHKFNAVVAVAGSWAGGGFPSPSSPHSEFEQYLSSSATMLDTNLKSAVFAAGLATRYLGEDGHLVLTGATASLSPGDCAGFMPGYGLSKNGVSYIADMLRVEASFKVSVIHPATIDTPSNREAMPDADWGNDWSLPEDIAKEVIERLFVGGEEGNFNIVTSGGKTTLIKL